MPRPWSAWVVLAAYLVGLILLVTWPDAWAVDRAIVRIYVFGLNHLGIPPSFGPPEWAVLLNVLVGIPPVAAVVVLLPRVRWWFWPVLALVLSLGVEFVQGYIGRLRDPLDVVANTLGALIGALLGRWWSARRGDRP